jgi:hypothetical protein
MESVREILFRNGGHKASRQRSSESTFQVGVLEHDGAGGRVLPALFFVRLQDGISHWPRTR